MCDENYGGALGSTSTSNRSGTRVQPGRSTGTSTTPRSSSATWLTTSPVSGKGCALSEALAENPKAAGTGTGATTIGNDFTDAFPTTLAADGKATSSIVVAVGDTQGYAVQGDHVHFSVGLEYGTGLCGKLC